MFSKFFFVSAVVLAMGLQVNAHAGFTPALGVPNLTRNDVQQPSSSNPCGNIGVATAIDKSTPVITAADGTATMTVTNFNG
jgi:hypothetical protein